MHAATAIGRLCLEKWKKILIWALCGPVTFLVYGAGSGAGEASGWGLLLAVGLMFGALGGIAFQVSVVRSKKNRSLTPLEHEIRGFSERELHAFFAVLGIVLGLALGRIFDFSPLGYVACSVGLVLLGILRNKIEHIIP